VSNKYTNRMRYALRTLKNPTPLDVSVVQQKDFIELRVDPVLFKRLGTKAKLNFISYLNDMVNIVESEGSSAVVTGVSLERLS
jgi:hypothetical protein